MQQLASPGIERRRDPRRPTAFALWLRPIESQRRTSAWMMNIATGGAAMLTAACDAPPVGERVELVEMLTTDRMVRDGATNLPRFARVLRHDDMEGLTRRIAVRFEADADEPRTTLKQRVATATMKRSCVAPIPPPSPTADGIGRLAGINATPP